jgi:hypothetical protein
MVAELVSNSVDLSMITLADLSLFGDFLISFPISFPIADVIPLIIPCSILFSFLLGCFVVVFLLFDVDSVFLELPSGLLWVCVELKFVVVASFCSEGCVLVFMSNDCVRLTS